MAGRAPTRSIEKELWARGHEIVVGIDEVGRGAWAGPLMVGAAVLPRDKRVNGVRDSKMLSAAQREKLARKILRQALTVGLGAASVREIDQLNIYYATILAMKRAISMKPGWARGKKFSAKRNRFPSHTRRRTERREKKSNCTKCIFSSEPTPPDRPGPLSRSPRSFSAKVIVSALAFYSRRKGRCHDSSPVFFVQLRLPITTQSRI